MQVDAPSLAGSSGPRHGTKAATSCIPQKKQPSKTPRAQGPRQLLPRIHPIHPGVFLGCRTVASWLTSGPYFWASHAAWSHGIELSLERETPDLPREWINDACSETGRDRIVAPSVKHREAKVWLRVSFPGPSPGTSELLVMHLLW